MIDKDKMIEMDIADVIIEKPYGFHVNDRQFYLYHPTIGKTLLMSRVIESLCINKENVEMNPYMEALRLCDEQKMNACRLISYYTINKKEDLFDDRLVSDLSDFFSDSLSKEEIAQILVIVLSFDKTDSIIKHWGIDVEHKELSKIYKVKSKSNHNTFTFCGKSILGSLIVPACEKLNMTPAQILWDISYQLVQLLMADSITSVCLTDEEKKDARINTDRNVINADDPKNRDKIKALLKG